MCFDCCRQTSEFVMKWTINGVCAKSRKWAKRTDLTKCVESKQKGGKKKYVRKNDSEKELFKQNCCNEPINVNDMKWIREEKKFCKQNGSQQIQIWKKMHIISIISVLNDFVLVSFPIWPFFFLFLCMPLFLYLFLLPSIQFRCLLL